MYSYAHIRRSYHFTEYGDIYHTKGTTTRG